jgi:glycosyltransferase involved in cell wall biosynthesis
MSHIEAENSIRVLLATPLGRLGRGGIDRLTDLIVEAVEKRPDLSIRLERLVTRGPGTILLSPAFLARAAIRLWRAAHRREVDLLHIQLSSGGSTYRKLMIGILARQLAIPYVVHLHSGIFDRFWQTSSKPVSRWIDSLFRESSAILVLGIHWARLIESRLPMAKEKIVILPNGTPSSQYDHRESVDGYLRIVFLGKLGKLKGTPQLVETLGRIAGRSDWTATIAGDGDIHKTRAHVRELRIADRVEIPGWLDAFATVELFRQADILVLPSFAENLPMVVLEAFAYGIPVVATSVGAIPELIETERNGLLVPAGDVDALANALCRLLDSAELRRKLGEAGRLDHSKAYEIGMYVTRLAMIWRQAAR